MHFITKRKDLISYIAISIIIFTLLLNLAYQLGNVVGLKYSEWRFRPQTIPYATHQETDITYFILMKEFIRQAERANLTAAQTNQMWNVIMCESGFRYDAKNPKSTATGVAQFLTGTWNKIAPENSSRHDYRLSLSLFIQYFQTNPQMWNECL